MNTEYAKCTDYNKTNKNAKSTEKQIKEHERLLALELFEEEAYKEGYETIAGMDEVGRGPLAGPVVAAMVVLPRGFKLPGINDSKKLSQKKREELFFAIKEVALGIGIGLESNLVIDKINILEATKEAMRKAYFNLLETTDWKLCPDLILIDALKVPKIPIPQRPIIKGDEKSVSIAAASIIAKVHRDKLMEEFHQQYPDYYFADNKGYGTKVHMEALRSCGPCFIHRRSFLKKL